MKRLICLITMHKEAADEMAKNLRERGQKTRVYQRTTRAEGLSVWSYVVVTDVP